MQNIKTPFRYPGGKAKALKNILQLTPSYFSEYREPFLGGGSVFVALKQRNPKLFCRVNDLNRDVYCFWKTLQRNPNDLINAIMQVKKSCIDGGELYAKLADAKTFGVFGRALRFYILNRITYSGIVDSGGYSSESFEKRFTQSRIKALQSLAGILPGVKITKNNYPSLLSKEGENVFIFLDPPYWNSRKSPLYGKNGKLNKFFNHKTFAENVKECKHKWLITCDDSEVIRKLFSSFAYITPWGMKYNGFNKKKAINGKEVFITNYELTKSQIELCESTLKNY